MLKIRLSICKESISFPPDIAEDPCVERWRDPAGGEYGFSLQKDGQCWIRLHRLGSFVFRPGHWEALGSPDEGTEPGRFREAFFHVVAPWILGRLDWECLHASAVLTASGVVAFCGPSGRGKSTLARACGDRGGLPYADDAVPFLIRDGLVMAACMPQPLRLRGQAASWFGDPPGQQPNGENGHEVLYDFEPTLRPLCAVYWLEEMSDAAERPVPLIERISPLESFRLLISEAYCLTLADAACNRKMVRSYLSLVRLAPVWRLSFPAGLERMPTLLEYIGKNGRE